MRIRALGSCMEPTFSEGATLDLEPVRDVLPRAGDLVAVLINGRVKTHRLVELGTDTVRTTPDQGLADAPLPRTALLGTVTHINGRPAGATFTSYFRRLRTSLRVHLGALRHG